MLNSAIQTNTIHSGKISIFSAAAVAVFVAPGIMAFQDFSLQVEAYSRAQAVKREQVNIAGPVARCSEQAWPYYDRRCLWVLDKTAGEIRTVRFVPIDRMQTANATVTVAK